MYNRGNKTDKKNYFQEDVTQSSIGSEGHVSCFDTTQSQVMKTFFLVVRECILCAPFHR